MRSSRVFPRVGRAGAGRAPAGRDGAGRADAGRAGAGREGFGSDGPAVDVSRAAAAAAERATASRRRGVLVVSAGAVTAAALATVLSVTAVSASAAPPPPPPPAGAPAPAPAPAKPGPPKPPPPKPKGPPPPPVIGDFTTSGFAPDSGVNIHKVADRVNNAVVAPGATFSLNGFTGPRTAREGYVDAGIIEDGKPARGVGGGISQFATTLYNATYFAGLQEVEHKPHSYWISRYPAGRDATVFDGVIDLKFRNDGPTPITIKTIWTPKSIRVQILGQKRFDVTSTPGARVAPKPHPTQTLPGGPGCKPTNGVDGFTIGDTRTLFAPGTKKVIRKDPPLIVHYDPEPTIKCGPPPPPPKPGPKPAPKPAPKRAP